MDGTNFIQDLMTAGTRAVAVDCDTLIGTAPGLCHVRIADVDAGFIAANTPDLIIVPLFGSDHDAVILVEMLEALAYGGRIAVLAPALPKPGLVERELRSLGPGARLVLITT